MNTTRKLVGAFLIASLALVLSAGCNWLKGSPTAPTAPSSPVFVPAKSGTISYQRDNLTVPSDTKGPQGIWMAWNQGGAWQQSFCFFHYVGYDADRTSPDWDPISQTGTCHDDMSLPARTNIRVSISDALENTQWRSHLVFYEGTLLTKVGTDLAWGPPTYDVFQVDEDGNLIQ
jgi:hypothetical protein